MQSRSEVTIDSKDTYMVTISCQQKLETISSNQLYAVILYLKLHIDSLHIIKDAYEKSGKYKQLHYHAIVEVKEGFRFSPFTQYGSRNLTLNTFSINWTKVYDLQGAKNYLDKDKAIFNLNEEKHYISKDSPNRFLDKYLIK